MAATRDPFDRVFTVPNILSLSRLALVPLFLYFLVDGNDIGALVTLVISSLTDFLDGFLARRLQQITRLGQLLDPAADRLYIFAALLGLASRELVPWWLVAVVVGRDLFLLALGIVLANIGYGPLPVHQLGKVATFALFFGLPAIMLGLAFPGVEAWAQPIGWAITLWGAFLYWWAGIIYAIETARLVRFEHGNRSVQSDTLGG